VQGDHVHLLCEANSKITLARGVQGFQISAAKHLNREITRAKRLERRRRGKVFADHYHVESIDSVRQVRHVLSYVLNNWRKHHQDRETVGLYEGRIDPFSSGVLFAGWKERTQPVSIPPDDEAPRVATPHTWYLTEGYKRAAPISVYEVPG
jgi:hypothetical protein